jgi:membrane-anchored glycerophosphoryl diester phosphodiesterase (GDPDase)
MIITILAKVKNKPAVNYLIACFILMLLFEFLISVYYLWPRNMIMFVEGIEKYSVEEMKRVVKEFHIGYWVGLFVACITSCLAFIGQYQSNNIKKCHKEFKCIYTI